MTTSNGSPVSREHWDTLVKAHRQAVNSWLEIYDALHRISMVVPSGDPAKARRQLGSVVVAAHTALTGKSSEFACPRPDGSLCGECPDCITNDTYDREVPGV